MRLFEKIRELKRQKELDVKKPKCYVDKVGEFVFVDGKRFYVKRYKK